MKQIKVLLEKYSFLTLLIVISISIAFRLYHSGQKKIFQVDELLSFQIINRALSKLPVQNFKDKWMTGSDYIDSFFTIKNENLKKDINFLMRNTYDSPHPNLYYIALRLTLSKEISGVNGLFKYYGIGLNIFFYSIGALFLYLLYMNVYKDKNYALLAVFLYSISLGAISNSLFIRMYECLSTSIIITTFLVFSIIDKDKPTLFDYCLLYVALTTGYLAHYYYTVFLILLIFVVLYHYIVRKQLIYFLYFCITIIQGFITAQAIYPQFIINFNAYRAKQVYSKIYVTKLLNNMPIKIKTAYELITYNIVYFLLLIIFSILILFFYHFINKNKKIINLKELYLFFISCSFSILVIYISPYETARYLFGVLALLIVIPIMFIRLLPIKSLRIIMAMVFCVIYIFYNFNSESIKKSHMGRFIYPPAEENIDRLFFRSNSATPVYFFSSAGWRRGLVVAYFMKDQKYKLITDKDPILNFNETGHRDLFLIIEEGINEKFLKEQIKNSNWFIKNQGNYRSYKIIHIKKSEI